MTFPQFVAFDAFGTLIHGNKHPGPYALVRDALNLDKSGFYHAVMKENRSLLEIATHLLGRTPDQRESRILEEARIEVLAECGSIRPYAETLPTLAALKERGIPFGIVSNLARPYEAPLLAALGEFAPQVFVGSFEAGTMKPEPAIYELFCKRMGCRPEQTLFVGDTLRNDLEAPERLGFKALLLRRDGKIGLDARSSGREIPDLFGVFPALGVIPRLEEVRSRPIEHTFAP